MTFVQTAHDAVTVAAHVVTHGSAVALAAMDDATRGAFADTTIGHAVYAILRAFGARVFEDGSILP